MHTTYLKNLQQNPFLHRLVTVFATSDEEGEKLRVCEGDDGSEDGALDLNWKAVSFEDFMDMMNALCDKSPFELKAHYAFKVFGRRLCCAAVVRSTSLPQYILLDEVIKIIPYLL